MTTVLSLSLDGFDAYFEELKKAEKDIDLVAEMALEAGAGVILNGMRRRASFSKRIEANIRMTHIMKDGNKRYLYLGILRDTDAEIARFANVYEFGGKQGATTSADGERVRIRSGRKHRPWIKPRSFIRATLRHDINKAHDAMASVFEDWLK